MKASEPVQHPLPVRIPTFSVILETENLAATSPEKLFNCLRSIQEQSISPTMANDFLVVQSGDIPAEMLGKIHNQFPWLEVMCIDENKHYYEAKMEFVSKVTGDVVVFCDSDCVYVTDWLESMVSPFDMECDVNIVTGETALKTTGAYTFAMVLAWFLPPNTNRKNLYKTTGYAANNVAFRRHFLLQHPIPCNLDISRGNCMIHARNLLADGYRIWKQPKARAIHPSPKIEHILLRFFLTGHNKLMCFRLAADDKVSSWLSARLRDIYYSIKVITRQLVIPVYRLPRALMSHPKGLLYLPVTTLIVLVATSSFVSGVMLSLFRPQMRLTEIAKKIELD
jgi:hypothetical protein